MIAEGIVVTKTTSEADAERSALIEAHTLVHGDRQASYGHPLDDYTRTAALFTAAIRHKLTEPIKAEEAALFMVLVKVSREINQHKRDNLVDGAGYFEVVRRIHDERQARGINPDNQ